MDLIENNKTAIVFLSGSSGELDWMLPILDKLLKKSFYLKIVFLSKHCKQSIDNNQMLFDGLSLNFYEKFVKTWEVESGVVVQSHVLSIVSSA